MPSTSSREEAACPACQKPLKDAVTASCGHTFCPWCLPPSSYMGAQHSSRILLCPLCKEEGKTETLMAPVPLGPLEETCCVEHGEKIYFFCENDAEFLCVLCREGPSHQAHTVGFLDEAIQPYRVRSLTMARACLRWGGECHGERDGDLAKDHGPHQRIPRPLGHWSTPRLEDLASRDVWSFTV